MSLGEEQITSDWFSIRVAFATGLSMIFACSNVCVYISTEYLDYIEAF